MSQFWKVVDSETRPFLSRKYFGPSPKKKEEEKQNGKNYRLPPKKERKNNFGFCQEKKYLLDCKEKKISVQFCPL